MGMADEGLRWARRGVVELEDWMVRFALISRLRGDAWILQSWVWGMMRSGVSEWFSEWRCWLPNSDA